MLGRLRGVGRVRMVGLQRMLGRLRMVGGRRGRLCRGLARLLTKLLLLKLDLPNPLPGLCRLKLPLRWKLVSVPPSLATLFTLMITGSDVDRQIVIGRTVLRDRGVSHFSTV